MKAIFFEAEQPEYFPGMGVQLSPGVNRLSDDHAAQFLAVAAAGTPVRLATAEDLAAQEATDGSTAAFAEVPAPAPAEEAPVSAAAQAEDSSGGGRRGRKREE